MQTNWFFVFRGSEIVDFGPPGPGGPGKGPCRGPLDLQSHSARFVALLVTALELVSHGLCESAPDRTTADAPDRRCSSPGAVDADTVRPCVVRPTYVKPPIKTN